MIITEAEAMIGKSYFWVVASASVYLHVIYLILNIYSQFHKALEVFYFRPIVLLSINILFPIFII
jgi:hypothetical protein